MMIGMAAPRGVVVLRHHRHRGAGVHHPLHRIVHDVVGSDLLGAHLGDLPNTIRSQAVAIAVAAQWISNFLVSATFPSLSAWSVGGTYCIYALMSLASAVFVWRWVPKPRARPSKRCPPCGRAAALRGKRTRIGKPLFFFFRQRCNLSGYGVVFFGRVGGSKSGNGRIRPKGKSLTRRVKNRTAKNPFLCKSTRNSKSP